MKFNLKCNEMHGVARNCNAIQVELHANLHVQVHVGWLRIQNHQALVPISRSSTRKLLDVLPPPLESSPKSSLPGVGRNGAMITMLRPALGYRTGGLGEDDLLLEAPAQVPSYRTTEPLLPSTMGGEMRSQTGGRSQTLGRSKQKDAAEAR